MRVLIAVVTLALAACSPPPSEPMPTEPNAEGEAATNAPPEAIAAIAAAAPGFTVTSAQSDNSTGAQGYRVAGTANGQDVDVQVMLMNEGWTVVAIRRDIAWADAPAPVRAANTGAEPARVVENRQPGADGIIYELYAAGATAPTTEIRLVNGQAAVMPAPH
jgi:hypothetical protein